MELLFYISLAFAGGLLLNLMPCVLPVLSLKIFHLLQMSGESKKKLRLNAIGYGTGVIVSFLLLAVILVLFRAAGQKLGWGFHLQSPVFLALMVLFLTAVSLNLLGVFEIGSSFTRLENMERSENSLSGAVFSGIIATVVATPCTAPFMGSAMGFAFTRPAWETLLIFLFLGAGMAFPFLAAAWFPGWIRVLPKPGRWMLVLKQFLAFPMFGTAVWLAWVFGNQTSVDGLALLTGAALLLSAGLYLYGSIFQKGSGFSAGRAITAVSALSLTVLSVGLSLHSVSYKDTATDTKISPAAETAYKPRTWIAYDEKLISRYRQAGYPVFVDFTADWCLSCKVNERTVLNTDEIMQFFEDKKIVLFKADWTEEDPAITDALEQLGRNGVPVYAVYLPGSRKADLLPEVLTKQIVKNAFSELK